MQSVTSWLCLTAPKYIRKPECWTSKSYASIRLLRCWVDLTSQSSIAPERGPQSPSLDYFLLPYKVSTSLVPGNPKEIDKCLYQGSSIRESLIYSSCIEASQVGATPCIYDSPLRPLKSKSRGGRRRLHRHHGGGVGAALARARGPGLKVGVLNNAERTKRRRLAMFKAARHGGTLLDLCRLQQRSATLALPWGA